MDSYLKQIPWLEDFEIDTDRLMFLTGNFVFHKKAFALATVPLELPRGMDMAARASADGISVRFVRGYDIRNAQMLSRMDIFFGYTYLRPEWSCKVLG